MDRATRILNAKADRAAWTRRQFVAGMGAGAIVAAGMRTRKASALLGIPGGAASSSSTPSGFLPAGHYVTANQPMVVVAPRPVAELSAWSFYLWAYYDGTNAIRMAYPLGVLGGSFPYVFELISGPPGMSIPQGYWILGYTWAQMQALGYGYLYYTPTQSEANAAWTVRCYSQDYQTDNTKYIDITGQVTTAGAYNSTSGTGYVFMSPSGSNSNVNPTFSAPLADLTGVYSATAGTSQYPGGILIARAGTYTMLTQGGGALQVGGNVNCGSIMAYPGEAVTFALQSTQTNGIMIQLGTNTSNCTNLLFQGVAFTGTTSAAECHYFEESVGGSYASQCCFDSISWPNVWSGTNPTNNSSGIFYPDPNNNTATVAEYLFINNCSETNRPSNGSVQANIHVMYKTNYCLTQGCSATGQTTYNPPYGITYKAGNSYIEMRCNTAPSLGVSAQSSDSAPTVNVELRYNVVSSPQYGLGLNGQNAASGSPYPLGATWTNRNSIVANEAGGAIYVVNTASITTIASDSDAIQYGSGTAITSATGITSTNTEAQASSGVFDASMNLTGSYATYAGTRGAQIK